MENFWEKLNPEKKPIKRKEKSPADPAKTRT
jgi:hypothetical protein